MERKLEMVYREGKGKITLDLDMFFPCTQRDFKKLLGIIDMAEDIEAHTSILYDCLSEKIDFIRSVINGTTAATENECMDCHDVPEILKDPNGCGKKYADLCKILCERYGLPEIDCEFVVKLKKSEFYTRIINGEERFVKKSGWRFSKYGREFEVYKQENCNVYHVLIADTGIGIREVYRKKDIPSIVTKEILDQLGEKKEVIDEARKDYRKKMIALGEWEKDEKPGKDTAEKKTSAGEKSDTHGGKEKFSKSKNKNESEEKTMKKFKNVKSFEDLKQQYRELLKANHPDNGGDVETMKEINIQYDALFKIWKDRHEKETGEIVEETAESTRMNFYTDFGWAGGNYDGNLTLKEIAKIVRAYVKEKYPLDKFSVRCSYASMCQELHVDIKEFNGKMYLKGDELPKDGIDLKGEDCFDYNYGSTIYASFKKMRENGYFKFNSWCDSDFIKAYDEVMRDPARRKYYGTMSEELRAVIDDVNSFVKSYNYEDCDDMQDYFDVNFWFFGVGVSDCVEVSKTRRINDKKEKFPAKTESKKNTAAEKENDTPGAIENLGREPEKSEKSFIIDADYIENLTKGNKKEVEKTDISKTETTTEAEQTTDSAGDMFEELAKAYITGKQTPAKKKEKKEKKEEKPEPVKEEQPKEEKEPEKVGYGYQNPSSMFSVEELEKMECGEIVEIVGKYGSDCYFSANHGEYKLVYRAYSAGSDAKYTGFIVNHKFYNDKKAISAEIKKDIDTELKKLIPDEETAKKNAGNLEEYQKRTIDAYLKSDFLEQARGCFYEGKEPDLVLYAPYKDFSDQDAINYILNPAKFVEDCAREYADSYNRVEIYERYIQYNHTKESLEKIKEDEAREEHKIKRIINSIKEEKTVKITLSNGNTVKAEARALKYMTSNGGISDWYILACDRQYLEHDEKGRTKDIKVDDIKKITHGQRVLYRAA